MKLPLRLITALACTAFLAVACDDDDAVPPGGKDAGSGGSTGSGGKSGSGGNAGSGGKVGSGGAKSTGGGDAGPDSGVTQYSVCGGKTGEALVDCGEYIVKHVAGCVDCHTPRNPDGSPDRSRALAGNPQLVDLDPGDPARGQLPAPNLTTLKSNGWTADAIKDAVLNGKRTAARGGGMIPAMPYYTLHNMAPIDADAIAAYLLSLEPIANSVPGRQPLPPPLDSIPFPFDPFPAELVPDSTLPANDANRDEADYGKYLASAAGACMECHTPRTPFRTLDPSKLFAGGEAFDLGPPFGLVVSANVTPSSNGIRGYAAEDVQKVLLQGVNKAGKPICPPMPVGPNGAFGGLKPEDALAIGRYIVTLPPIASPEDGGTHPACTLPPPPSDGGTADAGGSADASAD